MSDESKRIKPGDRIAITGDSLTVTWGKRPAKPWKSPLRKRGKR